MRLYNGGGLPTVLYSGALIFLRRVNLARVGSLAAGQKGFVDNLRSGQAGHKQRAP